MIAIVRDCIGVVPVQGNLKPEDKIIHVFTTKNTKKEVM